MGAVSVDNTPKAFRWRQTFASAVRVSRRIFSELWQPRVLITLALVVCLVGSAVAVAYSAHLNRMLYSTLSDLQSERDAYQRQWTQLLLEQSALSAHGHIEKQAVSRLSMQVPERDDIVVIRPGSTDAAGEQVAQH